MKTEQIEYLLDRKIVNLMGDLSYIKGKRVLITGAGTIGTELCNQLLRNEAQRLYIIDCSEEALYNVVRLLKNDEDRIVPILGNLQDINFVKHILIELKADIVFHTAAYKHVDLCEENPIECIKNNVFSLNNILSYIGKVEKFILVSTDKAVNPAGVYGASKKMCEDMILDLKSDKFVVVRFGNVFASSGSVFSLFKHQIENDLPVTITDSNMKRFFMTKEEACSLLLQVGNIGEHNNIYILKMGKLINMVDFAERMMYILNNKVDINYIGLRKGEKLKEELANKDEILFDTEVEGIKSLIGVKHPNYVDIEILEIACRGVEKDLLLNLVGLKNGKIL